MVYGIARYIGIKAAIACAAALSLCLMATVHAAEPNSNAVEIPAGATLLWEETFDDQTLPEGWQIISGENIGYVDAADPKSGNKPAAGADLAITNTQDEKGSIQLMIPVDAVNFRVQWRTYVTPEDADKGRAAGVNQIGNQKANALSQPSGLRHSDRWLIRFDSQPDLLRAVQLADLESKRISRLNSFVRPPTQDQEGWFTYAIEKTGRMVVIENNGERVVPQGVLPSSALDSKSRFTVVIPPGAYLDDLRLYTLPEGSGEAAGGLMAAYYPSLHKIVCAVYANDEKASTSRVSVVDEHDKQIAQGQVQVQTGTMIAKGVWGKQLVTLDLPPEMPEGRYRIIAELPDSEGNWQQVGQQMFMHKNFEWEGNTLGITDEVLPPFTPIQTSGQDVSVVLRKYTLSGLGLIEQVEAKGQDENEDYKPLLASPVVLRANGKALAGNGKFVSQAPNQVVYEGAAQSPAVTATLRNTIEEDGCMKIELTLHPAPGSAGGGKAQLDSLTLDIPVKDAMAPLWHMATRKLRVNPAGAAPKGEGVVWDSRKFEEPEYYGNFHPYYWLGADARGICWFADNDKGWVVNFDEADPTQSSPCQELIRNRRDGVLMLRVNLVQKPIALDGPRTIVFGLMATPAKPLPEDWRTIGRKEGRRILFSMPTLFGIPSSYGGKYPFNRDFSSFDYLRDNRLGKNNNNPREKQQQFVDAWMKRNIEGRPQYGDQAIANIRGRLLGGMGRYRDEGEQSMLTVYFDEFHGTASFHDEVAVYYSEWSGGDQWLPSPDAGVAKIMWGQPGKDWTFHPLWAWRWRIRSDKLPRSYQDFACWYGKQWIERGLGLYFDNTFPRYVDDPMISEAYTLPNGRMQPSAGIWAHREYLRRIWTMHQQYSPKDTPAVMMLHTTNTHVVPYMVWNEVNADLEWKMRMEKKFQEKFSPELLRTETCSRQSGNIPLGMGDISEPNVSEEWYAANKKTYARARVLAFLVHEIKTGLASGLYPQPVQDFGYGLPECKVVNYWDDNVPLAVSDDKCKWLLLQNNDELMVVLCTWNPEDSDVTLTFDSGALGLSPGEAVDAETGEALPVMNNSVTVPVVGYGARILKIK